MTKHYLMSCSSSISKLHTESEGSTVSFYGIIEKIRASSQVVFLVIRDSCYNSGRVQVVVPKTLQAEIPVEESYVLVTGIVKPLPPKYTSYQSFEIIAESVTVIGKSHIDVKTICPADAGPEVRLTQRHLFLRLPIPALTVAIREHLIRAIRSALRKDLGCTEVIPPSFVGVECEGGATLFKISHPGIHQQKNIPAYLTQSGQFHLEYAVPGIGDSFCIAPSYRAENSHTRRHLTEFIHAEAEFMNVTTMDTHVQKLETLLKSTLQYFHKYCKQTKILERYDSLTRSNIIDRLVFLQNLGCVRLTHKQAIQYCRDHDIFKDPDTQTHFDDFDDIPEAQERKMIDEIGNIVFLTHFPTETKSFYFKLDPTDPKYCLSCDVEVPGVGEIIGSGIRESDHDTLLSSLDKAKLCPDDYREYLDLRRFGPCQTAGFGLGVDRLLTWILDAHSIRDVVTFPRVPGCVRP